MQSRFTLKYWSALAVWSVLCAVLSQWHFPHVLFICEHVEAFYRGAVDDATLTRVMRTLVAIVWTVGAAGLTVCWQVFGLARCAS
ncbi:hypothetical protein DWV00_10865 [Trinickia dinghuensis]|uniref:Uncharacterized protein n=2 Tax=Trinickia dinghuensis TaxID=2291023 RepID=A0A3D8K105_9BURK|nr:hypothetical protein DWV00_10865 [Trinickia dinghuensis]